MTSPEFLVKVLEDKDWLYKYKEFFRPIKIKDFVITPPWEDVDCEKKIIINPKMGFGTGHHPTTRLVMENMVDIDFKDKNVIDIGCGSGILGALAVKLGAKYVAFVEIDPMAIESCEETVELNGLKKNEYDIYNIDIVQDYKKIDLSIFDLALINITYDVVEEIFNVVNFDNISYYLISGILRNKKEDIKKFFNKKGYEIIKEDYLDDWLFIKIRGKI
ncbi:MAG TPA: 50S ribosomal protein L11 methyltransferase [Spirochaetota bacterium]|nr:50S ribosomal protein L11 methyltransferase [Spirochaetota bacterium]HOM38987.1 50S ribosomal protein L11 methyltransferase [Spirochaetota bacterium]